MAKFMEMIRRYAKPYYKNVAGSVVLNVFSAIFNIFSFTLIVPILNILFRLSDKVYTFIPWDADTGFKEKLVNNAYWFVSTYMAEHGALVTLLLLAAFMIGMTLLKTAFPVSFSARKNGL